MGRPKRADEAGGIYHALNRGNSRAAIFDTPDDFEAFQRILAEGLSRYPCRILPYQLMPNHWHLVVRPTADGGMSDLLRWVTLTHTMRRHAHRHTSGKGHIYQGRFKSFPVQDDGHFLVVCRYVERNARQAGLVNSAEDWKWGSLARWLAKPRRKPDLLTPWPIARPGHWKDRVNQAMSKKEVDAVRHAIRRGSPFGDPDWPQSIARRLNLETTLRPRGRPKKVAPGRKKES
ncbi:transposase [Blastopirellula retiformator]|uniref:Transposase IS200 like protein n=1 Tax=Blastopirellula retiformator TaxID=2527970 RepID=A0A5C5V9C9_9BACT|nr:transposase [Blastopirellula retiformator]TWT34315.1 Transposase IS200 like protein [Blastopirellula retiformator]